MLGFPLGILSAAGAGVVSAGDFELIETQILGSAQASITFSNLATYASTYRPLQIRATMRVSRAQQASDLGIRLNGDAGSNYAYHALNGNGSAVASFGATSISYGYLGSISGNTDTASSFSAVVIDLLDAYSTTKNKTIRNLLAKPSSSPLNVGLHSSLWMNTSATSSVLIYDLASTNLMAGSRFSLYGIKG